ncbi:cutinase transcription factor 1 beta [Apiospora rasikravindrae]|uniref:Cutinase transcription factor 1 beta n=1 Tax=Apiospora rasikravindrae TaxID=990691 RepID=A0ABR1SM00_9PEZI
MTADNEAVALPGADAEAEAGAAPAATAAPTAATHSPEPQTQEPPSPTTTATQNPEEKDSAGLTPSKKRSASQSEPSGSTKVTKRRAARACVSCRARKVRCDVVEGAPCGNCRWDNVECVVQESRRRKKNLFDASTSAAGHTPGQQKIAEAQRPTTTSPVNISPAPDVRRQSEVSLAPSAVNVTPAEAAAANAAISQQVAQSTCATSFPDGSGLDGHVPSLLYQQQSDARTDPVLLLAQLQQATNNGPGFPSLWPDATAGFSNAKTAQFLNTLEEPDASSQLPGFIRPLPSKIAPEDNALLRAYVEYVHPYMPLMELHDFLAAINSTDGLYGQISLFLYHAVMFASTAYVDVKYLKEAGYSSRKAARKAFFQKTRLLYDFDYESDRLILVQALLLMTYWYETPDDQKDTWHWMGVAISLAHTIGLHRNPANTNMSPRKQKLWKRIWWSCFMRDRLIALGMRRPTRIKDEDYDVPMLDEGDFEIGPLADEIQVVNHDCTLVRDVLMQQELASMCVAKAKLCLCISQMLKAQYSVLVRDKSRPENTTNSTMMLHPKKQLDNIELVNEVDISLMAWVQALPACCQYRPLTQLDLRDGHKTIAVQRNLLHMVYYTTISALHRPQFLHSSPLHVPTTSRQAQEMSRMKVRDSASHITRMVNELHQLKLEKFLPTTGVTVILPAMIIHLLEMKNNVAQARDKAVQGFLQCMKVMVKLRDSYAAADYAVAFLDAALRKAAIDLQASQQAAAAATTANAANAANVANNAKNNAAYFRAPTAVVVAEEMATPPPENLPYMTQPEAALMNPSTVYVPPAELMGAGIAGNSPPETNKDGFTPSASSGSSNGSDACQPPTLDVEMDFVDNDQDEFDWNALTGTNIDFDQWLHFPGESVGGAKGATVDGGAADPFLNVLGDGPMVKA